MTPKSMPPKNNHDSKEKYSPIHVGTIEPRYIRDILIKKPFSCLTPAHNDIKFDKVVKTTMIVDTLLHSLRHTNIQGKIPLFQFQCISHFK